VCVTPPLSCHVQDSARRTRRAARRATERQRQRTRVPAHGWQRGEGRQVGDGLQRVRVDAAASLRCWHLGARPLQDQPGLARAWGRARTARHQQAVCTSTGAQHISARLRQPCTASERHWRQHGTQQPHARPPVSPRSASAASSSTGCGSSPCIRCITTDVATTKGVLGWPLTGNSCCWRRDEVHSTAQRDTQARLG
jgi:hypothetical protein